MRNIFFVLLLIHTYYLFTQNKDVKNTQERKGLIIGFGIGGGTISFMEKENNFTNFSYSLPNLKLGWMINKYLGIYSLFPGASYKLKGKDRGFEGITINFQYFIKNKFWAAAGSGITFDAPAFYTVDKLQKADFHFGIPTFIVGIGYEFLKKNNFTIDLQYRFFYGNSFLSDEKRRTGVTNMLILGFNWY